MVPVKKNPPSRRTIEAKEPQTFVPSGAIQTKDMKIAAEEVTTLGTEDRRRPNIQANYDGWCSARKAAIYINKHPLWEVPFRGATQRSEKTR